MYYSMYQYVSIIITLYHYMGVSKNRGTPKTPQNDHFKQENPWFLGTSFLKSSQLTLFILDFSKMSGTSGSAPRSNKRCTSGMVISSSPLPPTARGFLVSSPHQSDPEERYGLRVATKGCNM